ncbi:MAG: hypothetical protein OEW39_10935, partial [Deltaproteobacteria bacterium]|nr:hypothetical protein [Deltaproteobacteria bacterium]
MSKPPPINPSQALRQTALRIYSQGLERITPEYLMRQALRLEENALRLTVLDRSGAPTALSVPLPPEGVLRLIAVGKAAA